jgi:hypothetical protein
MTNPTVKFKFKHFDTTLSGRLSVTTYALGGLAVSLTTEMEEAPGQYEPYCHVSVRLPETDHLPSDVFYAKHWSENEGIVETLVELRIIELAPDFPPVASGFVRNIRAYRLVSCVQCPDEPRFEGDLVGCGFVCAEPPDSEGLYDCLNCGLFFSKEDDQRGIPHIVHDNIQ